MTAKKFVFNVYGTAKLLQQVEAWGYDQSTALRAAKQLNPKLAANHWEIVGQVE